MTVTLFENPSLSGEFYQFGHGNDDGVPYGKNTCFDIPHDMVMMSAKEK